MASTLHQMTTTEAKAWLGDQKKRSDAKKPPIDPAAPRKISIRNPTAQRLSLEWQSRQRLAPYGVPDEERPPHYKLIFIGSDTEPIYAGKGQKEYEVLDWMRENRPSVTSCWVSDTWAYRPYVTKTEWEAKSKTATAAA